MSELFQIPADFGKGGCGLSEPFQGVSVRDLFSNHRENITAVTTRVDQIIAGGSSQQWIDEFTIVGPPATSFPLSKTPAGRVRVEVNGATQKEGSDFVLQSGAVVWQSSDFALAVGDVLQIFYVCGA